MSSRIAERRLQARRNARAALAERAGLTLDQFDTAIAASYLAWSVIRPWCWLPRRIRDWSFDTFGGRHAARFVERWNA